MKSLGDHLLKILKSKGGWLGVLVFLLPLVLFSQAVSYPFLEHDDNLYLLENAMLRHGGWGEYLTSRYQGNWIPLTWASFALEWKLFGNWAGGYHLVNLLIHGLASVMLFLGVKRWGGSQWLALLVSLTFAIHPVSLEAVVWVTSRKDGLAALFALCAVFCMAPLMRRDLTLWEWGSVVFFFGASLMSKQSWVGLPLVLLGVMWLHRRPMRRWFPLVAVLGVMSMMACVMAVWANSYAPIEARITHVYPMSQRVFYAVTGGLSSVGDLFYPTNLSAFYAYPELSLWSMPCSFWVGLMVVVLGGAMLFKYWKMLPLKSLALCLMFSLVMWLPVSGLLPFSEAWRADRFFYIPQVGVWVVVYSLFEFWWRRRPERSDWWGSGVVVGCCVVWGALSLTRLPVWRSTESLFLNADAQSHRSYYTSYKLGYLAHQKGDQKRASDYFHQSLRSEPTYARSWSALGVIDAQRGDFKGARIRFETAIRYNPYLPDAWFNLGRLQRLSGEEEAAELSFQKAYRLEPALRKRKR